MRRAVSPPILVTHYFFPWLKNAEKELRKICTLEQLMETATKNNNHREKSLYLLFPHTTKYFWLANFSRADPIKVHFCYIMHKRLHCYKANDSSFNWKVCFPNTDHEILSKEFSFGHFLIHMHAQRIRPQRKYSQECYLVVSGKQNLTA